MPTPRTARDVLAGCTLALVAVPQCMAFATMAGLPPVHGIYAALAMGLLGAVVSGVPTLNIGPSVTVSTMVLAIHVAGAPEQREDWPRLAAILALLVGAFSVVAALLRVGQFARFVSQAVLVGLTAGAAVLILASQIGPLCGVEPTPSSTLAGLLWNTIQALPDASPLALGIGVGSTLLILLGRKLGPTFPGSLLALAAGGGVAWYLGEKAAGLPTIGAIPRALPGALPTWNGQLGSELVLGALAITAVSVIQTLAIAKTFAARSGIRVVARRELFALGGANVAAALIQGFPGAGSFARSGLLDLSGARSRVAGLVGAVGIVGIVLLFADLAAYVPTATIAGLLIATAINAVNWTEMRELMRGDRYDRTVVFTTLFGVLVIPLHWAILAGLGVSIAAFLKKVSRVHLFEMVAGAQQHFHEHEIDAQTGRTPITMLQVEGPLFFAQAEELESLLGGILERGPRVTILRMRRTQQIDFSVLATMHQMAKRYIDQGGTLIICGLTPTLRARLQDSALGRLLPDEYLISTTRQVFGSAHKAIQLARAQLPSGQLRRLQQQVNVAAQLEAAVQD